jgi:hypothetical protein
MPASVGRRRRLFVRWAWTILFAATLGASAQAETITVSLDEARILKMPDRVATIVIGNPLIADASLQSGGILVITAKGFGSTNLLALDRTGNVVMDKTVQVLADSGQDLVVVYRGAERESYSCAPVCEPRLSLGDAMPYFSSVLGQGGTRSSKAR